MSHREANLAVLAGRHPGAAAAVAGLAPDPSLAASPTPSGDTTARWRGRLLHSARDPRREARGLVSREGGSPTAGVLFGFGLGYAAEAFLERHPGVPLLVIEPLPTLFLAALEARDLAPLLRAPALALQVGGTATDAAAAMERLPLERPVVLRLRAEIDVEPSGFAPVEGIAQAVLLRREINVNTLERFGRLWVRNLAANAEAFARAPGVRVLADCFAGLPAVILAGGPTLEETLPVLAELRERAVIVAVNTPLAACRRWGVAPDVVVVVDPQYWASRHLDWHPGGASWLVAEPSTHPRSLRLAPGRIFFTGSVFPLGQRLEAVSGAKGMLGTGGSVSTTAWDLAGLMGCAPRYAAGLDLGYPDLRTHARPATFEEMRRASADRLAALETSAFRALREIGIFPAPAAGGGTVATDRRMILYRAWFEHRLAEAAAPGAHLGTKAARLSGRGLAVEGMAVQRPRELLALPRRREEIDARRRGVEQRLEASAGGGPAAVAAVLRELVEELARLESLAAEGARGAERLGREIERRRDPGASLRALDEIDGRILSLSARSVAGFLVQRLIAAVEGGGREASDAARTSAELYRGLRDSAGFHARVLGEALHRLENAQPSSAGGRCSG